MPFDAVTNEAIALIALSGAIGGLIGGLFASRSSNLIGSLLVGAIGGISAGAIMRILNVDPVIDAGDGFSWVWSFVGGLVLGLGVAVSNR
jgi:cobalamin synthase